MIDPDRLAELVGKFPVPAAKDGKLAEVDKSATDAALAELLKGGRETVVALVGLLVRPEKGGDTQARHALHALVVHVGGLKGGEKRMVAEALASTLGDKLSSDVNVFVLRQLQLVGGKEVVPAVAKFLADDALAENAALTLVAIGAGAAAPLRAALSSAQGRQVVALAQSLGTLGDAEAAPALRKLLAADESAVRQAAGRALANIGDAECARLLLRQSTLAQGFERVKLTDACFLLAENLLAAGKKKEAAAIYQHLSLTRREDPERHVRAAAERALAAIK